MLPGQFRCRKTQIHVRTCAEIAKGDSVKFGNGRSPLLMLFKVRNDHLIQLL